MIATSKDSFWMWGVGLAVLLVGTGIGVYVYQRDRLPEAEPTATTAASTPPDVPAPRPIETALPTVRPRQSGRFIGIRRGERAQRPEPLALGRRFVEAPRKRGE